MVKGLNDKKSGFWMYLESIRPRLEREVRRRLMGAELGEMGRTFWMALSEEDKQVWKDQAKNFNLSAAGLQDKMQRRADYRERKHQYAETLNMTPLQVINRAAKPSFVVPLSRRYDEVDRLSKVYFSVDDDFAGKRAQDVDDYVRHLRWKYPDPQARLDQFPYKELCMVTANVFYELDDRVYPSEISILKFNIDKGITSQRTFILGLTELFFTEDCETDAVDHEMKTGLSADPNKMGSWARTDFGGVWDEIKEFTAVAEARTRLLCYADRWNQVVGAFQTLFCKVEEQAFCRVDTRFMTVEDYFLAMAQSVEDWPEIDDGFKRRVEAGFRWEWPTAIDYDMVTCPFHSNVRQKSPQQAKCCSLKRAHEAAFNLFLMCRDVIFPHLEFNSSHFPETLPLSYGQAGFDADRLEADRPVLKPILKNSNSVVRPLVDPVGVDIMERGPTRNLKYEDAFLSQTKYPLNSTSNSMEASGGYRESAETLRQRERLMQRNQQEFIPVMRNNYGDRLNSDERGLASFNVHDGRENEFPMDRFANINRNRLIEVAVSRGNENFCGQCPPDDINVVCGDYDAAARRTIQRANVETRSALNSFDRLPPYQNGGNLYPSNHRNLDQREEVAPCMPEGRFEQRRGFDVNCERDADPSRLNRRNLGPMPREDVPQNGLEEYFGDPALYRLDSKDPYSAIQGRRSPAGQDNRFQQIGEPVPQYGCKPGHVNPYQMPRGEAVSVPADRCFEQQGIPVLVPQKVAEIPGKLSRIRDYNDNQRNFDYSEENLRLGAAVPHRSAGLQSAHAVSSSAGSSQVRLQDAAGISSDDFADERSKTNYYWEKLNFQKVSPRRIGMAPSRSFSSEEMGGFSSPILSSVKRDIRNAVDDRRMVVEQPGRSKGDYGSRNHSARDSEVDNAIFDLNSYQITYKIPPVEANSTRLDFPDRELEAALREWCSSGYDDRHYPL